MKHVGFALVVLAYLVGGLGAQDGRNPFSKPPPKKEDPPPNPGAGAGPAPAPAAGDNGAAPGNDEKRLKELKSLNHYDNYEKALGYIKKNFAGRDWRTLPDLWCGLVFLLDGREEHAADLEKAISIGKRKIMDDKAFNGNWFVAYSALFLAIVYAHEPLEDVKQALEAGFEVAIRTAEDDTKGWGHNKGWGTSSGYYKRGGAKDLGMVTATMVAAALLAREHGVNVPKKVIDYGLQNLGSIARGGVVPYGTSNSFVGCLSKSASAFVGLHAAKMSSNPIYGAVTSGLARDFANIENGHAYGPIHFFGDAMAAQLVGNYGDMASKWLGTLGSRQDGEGATSMGHDGGKRGSDGAELGATAVYALMILMQKQKLIPPAGRKPAAKAPGAPGSGGGGSSPFGRGRPKIDDKDLPTGEAPKGPTTGNGNKDDK